MAQPSERGAGTRLALQAIGAGLAIGLVSLALIPFLPAKIFLVGLLAAPVPILLGIGMLIYVAVSPNLGKPDEPLLVGGPERSEAEMMRFKCAHCERALKAQTRLLGVKITCPHCQHVQPIARR